ncbi:MAG: 16S rRNA (adenine(1518)-N(6)/adenine(1519)-N(6))-dimethyltransferase RsmA [Gammaproteobacteria bacterium]|nr:MAG: 16S rRNA (adenine(1518)-N(6)/adenine(1519)-N(6))-dimethyltransferase RsmA [Gammaproteobacteria bacterium]
MSRWVDGHQARKRFGQNFLSDARIVARIVRLIAPKPGENLVEIGPGLGAMTEPLLAATDHLTVIELDRDLVERLKERFSDAPGLTIYSADALKFDFSSLTEDGPLRVVGNLPYNISTPLLLHLFRFVDAIQDMHFMLQKELVQRMCATPGNKQWGRLSVIVQYFAEPTLMMTVPASAFRPQPKVESAIVRLRPHAKRYPVDVRNLEKVTAAAFGQRRKTIRNSLSNLFDEAQLKALGFDPTVRAEQLSLSDFVKLADALAR